MVRVSIFLVSVACLTCSAFAQKPLEFDAATVKPNTSGAENVSFQMTPGGLFEARNIPLKNTVAFAFKVRDETLFGSPAWFDERFDVVGRAPAQTSEADFRAMLQSLLRQEFKLVTHTEQRTVSAFVLTIRKDGSKLQKAKGDGEPTCKRVGPQGKQAGGAHVECTNMTMAQLVEELPDMAPGQVTKTAVDQTGLTEAYDFRLDWVAMRNLEEVGGLTMFGTLEKLGLKLEEKKMPLTVVVIDKADRLIPQ